eukprot:Gb_00259 [translate_table: standard]
MASAIWVPTPSLAIAKLENRAMFQEENCTQVHVLPYGSFKFLNHMQFDVRHFQNKKRGNNQSFCFRDKNALCKEVPLSDSLDSLLPSGQLNSDRHAYLLQICINKRSLVEGKQVHAKIIRTRPEVDGFIKSNLVNLYAKCGSVAYARHVFDKMPERNVISWTAMIAAYVQNRCYEEAFELLSLMQEAGARPDQFTFPCLLKACAGLADVVQGKLVHAVIIKTGSDSDVFVGSALVDMYTKCGSVIDARLVFDKMPRRNVVSWTAIITGYGQTGHGEEALELFHQMQRGNMKPNRFTLASVLKVSAGLADLERGKQLHAYIVKTGFDADTPMHSALVVMYAKSGSLDEASKIFFKIPKRDSLSWNAIILGYVQNGYDNEALSCFCQMHFECLKPDHFTFASVLRACASIQALKRGKEVHGYSIKSGLESNDFVGSALVDMYAKSKSLNDAHTVFDKMPEQNAVSWNAMIGGYSQNEHHEEAIELFCQMQWKSVRANSFTFTSVLSACAGLEAVQQGKQIHGHIIRTGFEENVFVCNPLVTMYTECGYTEDAHQVFDKMLTRNVISWTAIIGGYERNGFSKKALHLFEEMQLACVRPNQFTFTSVLKACASLTDLKQGKQVHAWVNKTGLESHSFVRTALVNMYAECGIIHDAQKVFDKFSEQDAQLWSAMIVGYAQNGYGEEAVNLLCKIQLVCMKKNSFTFSSILKACVSVGALEQGKQIHAHAVKTGFEPDVFVGSSLVDMYAKCGSLEHACQMFNAMPHRNVVSWNAMVTGYSQNGNCDEALKLFWQMQRVGMKPDKFTFVSALGACAALSSMEQGKQVHICIIKTGYDLDIAVQNAVVTMYAKSGHIENAYKVFENMPERNVISWTAMITAYGQHGCAKEAIKLFDEMQQAGIQPSHITFVGVLSACSHVGLVDEGRRFFNSMSRDHGIMPRVEHYACMVDLLGRAGCLDEAEAFSCKMPFKSGTLVWRTLLGACRIHGNIELGKHAAECILELEPQDRATYVLLSNIYAALGRWDDVAKVRKMMKDRGVKKEQGLSWIEVKNRVHTFSVQDRSHPQTEEIYAKLEELTGQMREAGYVPDTNFVLHNIEEEQKETYLSPQ